MRISFENATASDANALADLRVAAMRESLERIGRFDPIRARDRLLSGFDPTATRHVLADGVRVGFFVIKVRAEALHLDHLYVDPRHQSRGIGAVVLAEVMSEADRQGRDLQVGALKHSASNRFYVRHGFELVEAQEWDNFYVRRHRAGGR
jgi:GNAT superfamily N-acetyltransferase